MATFTMTRSMRRASELLAWLVFSGSAVEAQGQPVDGSSLDDPCDFLSVQEIEAATGVDVLSMERLPSHSDVRAVPPRAGTVCRYTTSSAVGAIDLNIYSSATHAEASAECDGRASDAVSLLSQRGVRVCIASGLAASISLQISIGEQWRVVARRLAEAILERASK